MSFRRIDLNDDNNYLYSWCSKVSVDVVIVSNDFYRSKFHVIYQRTRLLSATYFPQFFSLSWHLFIIIVVVVVHRVENDDCRHDGLVLSQQLCQAASHSRSLVCMLSNHRHDETLTHIVDESYFSFVCNFELLNHERVRVKQRENIFLNEKNSL
jgi:hypothetical protein